MFYVKNKGGYMNSKKDCAGTYPVSAYIQQEAGKLHNYLILMPIRFYLEKF